MSSFQASRPFHAGNGHDVAGGTLQRLPAAEEAALIREAQAGSEEAKAVLLEAYQPLVAGQAWHVLEIGLETEDLMEAGRLAVLEAIRGFDFERGTRLATPAGWWVRWELEKASASALPQPLPEKEHRLRRRVQAVALRLEAERGEQPSATAVALASGLPVNAVRCRLSGSPAILSLDELDTDQLAADETDQDGHDDTHAVAAVRAGLAAVAARLSRRLGRAPRPDELSDALRLPLVTVEAALRGERAALSQLALALANLTGSSAVSHGKTTARAA